ncbi:MAG: hypothetical protein ACP5NG_00420 [Conexivisphaera sp.]
MKREHVLIPLPRSAFLLVKCPNCGAELTRPTGGRAIVLGEIVRRLD